MRNKDKDRERYLRNREKILAQQKVYRETHKEEIKARRRERDFIRVYMNPTRKPPKTRQELNRSYYERHREEIRVRRKIAYERRKQDSTAGSDGPSTAEA